MGLFPPSFEFVYILLAVDYLSKWVEAKATWTNDTKVVVDFIKTNIFARFGTPKAIISYRGMHFCNRTLEVVLNKYDVMHQVLTAYHRQTNGQTKASNRRLTGSLKKRSIQLKKIGVFSWMMCYGLTRRRIKTSIRMSPYRIIFWKPCRLPAELEHQAYWVVKSLI